MHPMHPTLPVTRPTTLPTLRPAAMGLTLALALALAGSATAAPAVPAATSDLPLWELGLGLGVLHLPHYRGSDQSRNWLLPIPYFVYRGEVLRADREGAHAVLVDAQRFGLDISLAANTPTRSSDNRARVGMPNLAPTVEVGPSASLQLQQGPGWRLDLRLPVRAVVALSGQSKAIGWTAAPVLNLDLPMAGWDVAFQGGPAYASRRYNSYFYDVAPAFAQAGRPAYAAPGGNAGWVLNATASKRLGDLWIGSFVQWDSLAGAGFADSPLVRQRQNLSLGVGVSWIFKESQARARSGS